MAQKRAWLGFATFLWLALSLQGCVAGPHPQPPDLRDMSADGGAFPSKGGSGDDTGQGTGGASGPNGSAGTGTGDFDAGVILLDAAAPGCDAADAGDAGVDGCVRDDDSGETH